MSTRTISVIIPAWNAERWIARAVRSALDQDPAPLEVIVVDDGSTDDTAAAAAACGASVRVLRGDHAGTATARNMAMDAATGDLLAFLDADDEWLPGKLSAQIEALVRMPTAGVAYCDLLRVDPDGVDHGRFLADKAHAAEGAVLPALIQQCFVLPSAAMVRRDLCDAHRVRFATDIVITEDYEFWLTLARHTGFARVPEPLVRRLVHPQAKTHAASEQAARDHVTLFLRLRETLATDPGTDPELLHDLDDRLAHFERSLGIWRYRAGDLSDARHLLGRSFGRRRSPRTLGMWAVALTGAPGRHVMKWIRRSA